jgi:hypothetical protein
MPKADDFDNFFDYEQGEVTSLQTLHFEFDFNEITPSKLLRNNIKVKDKYCGVLVYMYHKSALN